MKGWSLVLVGTRPEADLAIAVLEAAGCHPVSFGDDGAYNAALVESRVFVPEEEAETARKILDSGLKSPPEGR